MVDEYIDKYITEDELESTFEELVDKAFAGEKPKYALYIDDNDFLFGAYGSGKFMDICLWKGKRSQQSLYQQHDKEFKDVKKIVDILTKRVKDSLHGILHCSACGAPFPAEEVAGYKRSYFAGVYCQKCWDTKYKAIEANETYD